MYILGLCIIIIFSGMKFNLILDMIWKLQINDDDAGPGAEEEECNDDLDIGSGVGISTFDHSLEPAWHLQMYQLLSDLSDQIGQRKNSQI